MSRFWTAISAHLTFGHLGAFQDGVIDRRWRLLLYNRFQILFENRCMFRIEICGSLRIIRIQRSEILFPRNIDVCSQDLDIMVWLSGHALRWALTCADMCLDDIKPRVNCSLEVENKWQLRVWLWRGRRMQDVLIRQRPDAEVTVLRHEKAGERASDVCSGGCAGGVEDDGRSCLSGAG